MISVATHRDTETLRLSPSVPQRLGVSYLTLEADVYVGFLDPATFILILNTCVQAVM